MCVILYGITARHKAIKKGRRKMFEFQVIDQRTGYLMGTYSTFKRAMNKADKLDLAYGGYRYSVKKVEKKV